MQRFVSVVLVLVGIVHVIPVSGVWGAQRLGVLYGVMPQGDAMIVLMRHRAVLFGVLGALMIYAAWRPALQSFALGAGVVSVASFLMLARQSDAELGAQIERVVLVDLVALMLLVCAIGARTCQVYLGAGK